MTEKIKSKIDKFDNGYVFTADEFPQTKTSPIYVNRILGNFLKEGYIKKLSKGKFYKPETGKFGELPPHPYQVVKDLLEKKGKPIGYITGYSVFNDLLLTTQVPSVLQIGTQKEKKKVIRGIYRIHFVKQENIITKDNIPLLQLLDCLRLFKTIPDTTPNRASKRLINIFKGLNEQQIAKIKKLAVKCSPQTIALLGAILETLNPSEDTELLHNKLNPMTTFKLHISNTILLNQKRWKIL
jgi:predicted transcriptional regulator of viral defense system